MIVVTAATGLNSADELSIGVISVTCMCALRLALDCFISSTSQSINVYISLLLVHFVRLHQLQQHHLTL